MPFPALGAKSMQKARSQPGSPETHLGGPVPDSLSLPPVSIETWADALADMVALGLVKAVSVSNFNETQMPSIYDPGQVQRSPGFQPGRIQPFKTGG
jgi:diketogulonate reductase-like aldo/keto reductase